MVGTLLVEVRRKIDLSKRLSVIMACGGMSIEFTENGRLLRPGFTEAVKAFYGYAAIWLLIMGLLSLSGITLLEFEILPDSTVLFGFPRFSLLLFSVPKLHWLLC